MKFLFDVDERNDKFQIKIEIQKGNAFNASASQIIECSKENSNWPRCLDVILKEIIDEMRLTVKEREEAYRNSNVLLEYLIYNNPIEVDNRHQMIVENGDPAVLVKKN